MNCIHCGKENPEGSKFCASCGRDAAGAASTAAGYAGFWKRFGAGVIDLIALMVINFVVGFAAGLIYVTTGNPTAAGASLISNIIAIAAGWLYFAKFESSSKQATPGKMALGIKVTDMDGGRITFGRATGRHFAKIVSAITLLIGYFMIAFTGKKQGLHDIMAKCLVVNR